MNNEDMFDIVEVAAGAFPSQYLDYEQTAATWYAVLGRYDKQLVFRALFMCLRQCKKFPAIAEVLEVVNQLLQERNVLQAIEYREGFCDDEKLKELVRIVKDGRLESHVQNIDISGLRKFCRKKWGKVSDEFILANFNDLNWYMESEQRCEGCSWTPSECSTSGYRVLASYSGGKWAAIMMTQCSKK